jgi:hypothetical protein
LIKLIISFNGVAKSASQKPIILGLNFLSPNIIPCLTASALPLLCSRFKKYKFELFFAIPSNISKVLSELPSFTKRKK